MEMYLTRKYAFMRNIFTPVKDSQSIPTGEYAPVAGTPMDFNVAKPIGRDIEADFER